MYRSSPPTTSLIVKNDPTAASRSPIRRPPTNSRSPRLRSRGSAVEPLSSITAEPYIVPGNFISPVAQVSSEPNVVFTNTRRPRRLSSLTSESPSRLVRPPLLSQSPQINDATPRMQVTRQQASHPTDIEADAVAGRFVVRPILTDDEDGTHSPARSPVIDPMDLLLSLRSQESSDRRERAIRPPRAARERSRSPLASRSPTMPRSRHRSTSDVVLRANAINFSRMDGLGDRERSPSVGENDWETLRASIPLDAQLPSASSSFTSASAASSGLDRNERSSTATSTTTRNYRYVLPTAECLDITIAQLECGVVCDDACDAQPPFTASRAPSRSATRQPSHPPQASDRHVNDTVSEARYHPRMVAWDALLNTLAGPSTTSQQPSRSSTTAPDHLRASGHGSPAPSEPQPGALAEAVGIVATAAQDLSLSRRTLDANTFESSQDLIDVARVDAERPASNSGELQRSHRPSEDTTNTHPGLLLSDLPPNRPSHANSFALTPESLSAPSRPQAPRLGARLDRNHARWHQLRRIDELLRCDQDVPGWLLEVAGLAPDLVTREFES